MKFNIQVFLFSVLAFFSSYLSYWMGYNSDGAWLEGAWFMILVLWILAYLIFSPILLFNNEDEVSRKTRKTTFSALSLLFLLFILSKLLGDYFWREEFHENRMIAENIINQVEKYRDSNGVYPKSLNDLDIIPNQIITKNGLRDTVYYKKRSDENFVVHYQYGWYSEIYNSIYKEWFSSD